ncbi:MAG TPA: hypothetical protein VHU84_01975 [Lacipirellulaceae bacterium]|nr:hypothetical protein [Lacipirellulaceae bacterium]
MLPVFGHFLASTLLSRRTLTAALLGVYLLTAAGVPLPAGGLAHSDELYPCANHACGCPDAEHCWRSCCCFTLAERFDWARQHNVRPPDYAIAAAESAGLDLSWLGIKSPKAAAVASCCDHATGGSLPPCCQKHVAACCEHEHGDQDCCAHVATTKRPAGKTDYIVAWRAMGCHGESMNWVAAAPTLLVLPPTFSHALPLVKWLGPAMSETAGCTSSAPELPPPERA